MSGRHRGNAIATSLWAAASLAPQPAFAGMILPAPDGQSPLADSSVELWFLAFACVLFFVLLSALAYLDDAKRRLPRALLEAAVVPLLVIAAWLLPKLF